MKILCKTSNCRGEMKPGIATGQTFGLHLDFIGEPPGRGCTMSPGGPGKLISVLKCEKCGYSFSI